MSSTNSTQPIDSTIDPPGSSSFANRSSRKRGQAFDVASTGLNLLASISEATDVLSPLKAICKSTGLILEVIQAVDDNQEGWDELRRRLEEYMVAVKNQIDVFESYPPEAIAVDDAFKQPLIRYIKRLEEFHKTVTRYEHKRRPSGFGAFAAASKIKMDVDMIKKFNRDIEDCHRQLSEQLNLFVAHRIEGVDRNIKAIKANGEVTTANMEMIKANFEVTKAKVEKILSEVDASAILQLPMVAFAAASVHRTCLQGTRQAVLQTIWNWTEHSISQKPIFWLCDIAGSGKSTVAMSVANRWRTEGILGGQFFFSLSSNDGSSTEKFCSTIARELVQHMPELAPHVAEAVKRNPAIMRDSFHEQLRTLVIDPLHHRQDRVFLVIDAVDECKSGVQRKELLDGLAMVARETRNLRIFITSRPDPVIEAVLRPLSIKAELRDRLHSINHHDNIDDITAYVHESLHGVLSQDKRQRLVEKAQGLFIWASTACRMLKGEATLDSPESIYNRLVAVDQTGDIDEVYSLVFERVDSKSYMTMCHMLGLLLAAFEPLPIGDLDDLFKHAGIQGTAKVLVQNLGSVLTEDATTHVIQFRHPTMVEYLRRCSIATDANNRNRISIDMTKAHGQAASWCLKCLKSRNEGLRFNICQLESSFYLNRQIPNLDVKVSKFIPTRLRYAVSHWLLHVAETDDNWQRTLRSEVRHVLRVPYVLYWMEVLSLTGGVSRAISGLRALTQQTGLTEETISSITEVRRCMMAFLVPIQDSVPHIYISMLPFTPRWSNIHLEGLKKYRNTFLVTQGLEETYPGLPEVIEGHKGSILAVAFSPDGSQFVSGSKDMTIRIWDADTGQSLGEPLRGHNSEVSAIAFSPDASRIISGSGDSTIRLWDAVNGRPLGEPLRGHRGKVITVAFSPDGSRIVSGSEDGITRLWHAVTGELLGEPLLGQEKPVNAIAFSLDGSRIVSGSREYTLRLCDVDSGQILRRPLRGHLGEITAIAFSPNGSRIASRSQDYTIRIWDAETCEPLGESLQDHRYWAVSLAFSPDSSRIASISVGGTIRLWDVETCEPLGKPFRGHGSSAVAVAFSPDGSRIVCGEYGGDIRLWNAETCELLGEPLRGHRSSVAAVAFSPDGSRVASGSHDNTIRLWNAETGEPLGEPLQGHPSWVVSIAFSPDGSRIVSGSLGGDIRLWDAVNGQQSGKPLRGRSVSTVGFSPDGSQIVSGSEDSIIQLWDAETGVLLREQRVGHMGQASVVALSQDGSRIVFGSKDDTIRIWDADNGELLGEQLNGHQDVVTSVAFSPDGSRIVSSSEDQTVRLWDAETCEPLGEPLRGHGFRVTAVAFSPDGSRIASSSRDHTIRLWDAETCEPFGEPLQGHEYWAVSIAFSPDSSRIVSGSLGGDIRLWDAANGKPLGESLLGNNYRVYAVAFSPDGSRIVSSCSDEKIRIWDADTGQPLGEPLCGHQDAVTAVAFSPNGSRIASGSEDDSIWLWDVGTGEKLRPLYGHDSWVTAVAFSSDSSRIVSGSEDCTVRLWDADTGQRLREPLQGHEYSVTSVAFSPNGSRIVSGSNDSTIRLWDAMTGESLRRLDHEICVSAVAFSPDGSRIVSGSLVDTVQLWDAETGEPLGEPLRGHQGEVNAVAFSPDSSIIVSCSWDQTIRLWDACTGEPLGEPLRGHQHSVSAVGFSPDGLRIVSGSLDGTTRLWDVDTGKSANNSDHSGSESTCSGSLEDMEGTPLGISVPGFELCSLVDDGWVKSSEKFLFWVPPNNRHGLIYPHLLTMPTTSEYRATRLDFTRFHFGGSWTNVCKDAIL